MPKLRISDSQVQDAFLRQAIKGSAGYYQLGVNEQATVAGCGRATWYRRLSSPGTFTLTELRRMVRRYHWTEKQCAAFLGVREGGSWDI